MDVMLHVQLLSPPFRPVWICYSVKATQNEKGLPSDARQPSQVTT